MSIEKTFKCRTYVDVDGSSKCRPDMVDICVHPYTVPHMNFADDNTFSGTPEAISAYMY